MKKPLNLNTSFQETPKNIFCKWVCFFHKTSSTFNMWYLANSGFAHLFVPMIPMFQTKRPVITGFLPSHSRHSGDGCSPVAGILWSRHLVAETSAPVCSRCSSKDIQYFWGCFLTSYISYVPVIILVVLCCVGFNKIQQVFTSGGPPQSSLVSKLLPLVSLFFYNISLKAAPSSSRSPSKAGSLGLYFDSNSQQTERQAASGYNQIWQRPN